jgi:RNA polymerase sigma factor (sigma-70 family)
VNVIEYNLAVKDYSDGLYRFMLKKANDVDIAKDLVQSTFEKVWIKRESISYEKAKSYLFSTAFHTFIDFTRRDKKMGQYDTEIHNSDTTRPVDYGLKEALDEGLQKLPDIQKTVLLLRDYEGYDYVEIGKITGLKESQVKVYIFRARKAMKNYLVSIDLVL